MGEGLVKQLVRRRKKYYAIDPRKVLFGDGILRMDGVGEIHMGYFIVVKKENETVAKSIDDYYRRIGKNFYEQPLKSTES